MADRYWVGTSQDFHSAANWSATSGGAGGAGVPTSSDDVFIDGNGYALCWAHTPFECNDLSLVTGASELLIIDQGCIIHGDFLIEDGYFGPTGGGGYTVEFKGNWLNTGGTFSVGTGTGVDPTCEFSGIGKTYNLNSLSAASFQHVLVSGEVIFSGTRLSIMNISQKLNITGKMTVNANWLTICAIDLSGLNAGFGTFTGTLKGTGRLWYRYRSTHMMVTTGTISIKYFRYKLETVSGVHNIPARQYETSCTVEVYFDFADQIARLGEGDHYFLGPVTLRTDSGGSGAISGEFDCDTNTARMWVGGKFDIEKNSFYGGTLTLKLGNGIHVFRGSIDFYFSYGAGATTVLDVQAGEGTIILWPKGLRLTSPSQ